MKLSFLVRQDNLEALRLALDRHNGFIEIESPPFINGMVAVQASFNNEEDLEAFARGRTNIQVF